MRLLLALAVAATLSLSACGSTPTGAPPVQFALTSPDVATDGTVPEWAIGSYGGYCEGENRSITLQWSGAPAGTESFAVSMLHGTYVHWLVVDIPATAAGLAATPDGAVDDGVVGTSLAGAERYIGPCLNGSEYVYTVYALDTTLGGTGQTDWPAAQALMEGHVLASASLTTQIP
jgi:Raf kinase inhibitor-like YbhB/YbcL family protein